MKTNIKVAIAALSVGIAVLLLTGCHHLGGGSRCASSPVPVATATAPPAGNSSTASAPELSNAHTGHQH